MEFNNYVNPDKLLVKIPSLHILKSELRYATQYLT